MNIYIGADHRGYKLKKSIIKFLKDLGHNVVDVGSHVEGQMCDYPKISKKVATSVAKSKDARGILLCMTGIGHSIAANKVPGAYATLCYNKNAAKYAREHNNSNVLVIGSKFVLRKELYEIVKVWLKTEFGGGRHLRRVNQIKKIEKTAKRK